jgi:hypothetical protein
MNSMAAQYGLREGRERGAYILLEVQGGGSQSARGVGLAAANQTSPDCYPQYYMPLVHFTYDFEDNPYPN